METIILGAHGFDLNLLRVLIALDRTRHVTKAAALLDMSQSGFSSALARLRQHAGDTLFVRGAAGMTPTPRAQKMIEAARNALITVGEGVLAPPAFEPATASTEFRFAMSDLAEVVFLPKLLHHLQSVAPHTSASSEQLSADVVPAALADGAVDLALGYFPELSTQTHFHQRLYRHTFACLVRRGHPLDRGRLTTKAFAELGQIVVTSPARSGRLFDTWLHRKRIKRRIVLRTPHHLSLPTIVESTDLIAIVPLAVGARFATTNAVDLVALPFKPPMFNVEQHWHRRFQHDMRHRWLRQQIATLFNDRTDDWAVVEHRLYGTGLRKKAR